VKENYPLSCITNRLRKSIKNLKKTMKTQIVLGIAAIALGMVAVNSLSPVLAYRGDPSVKSPNYAGEKHQINTAAFQNGDYKAWSANMQGRGATRFVNESNFKEFASAQVAAQKGDTTLLNAFRTKYGMGQGQRKGQGNGSGIGRNQ